MYAKTMSRYRRSLLSIKQNQEDLYLEMTETEEVEKI